MTDLFNVYTERIFGQLRAYRDQFVAHPLFRAADGGRIPLSLLKEFAAYQYADSVLWIPMLALLRARAVRSPRLQRAIEENIACEAGLGGTSHVALAANLMRSLGPAGPWAQRPDAIAAATEEWLSDAFAAQSEPLVAGWLLLAESLVPVMFAKMLPCFARVPGCDVAYFSEHVAVDEAEHAAWMEASVREVLELYGPAAVTDVLAGMESAWLEVLEVPTTLSARLE